MDALISLARDGNGSSKYATLYCTTEPCHNCARHIIAAGIKEVVYYEPYPKSKTLELHGDAVTNESKKTRLDVVGDQPRSPKDTSIGSKRKRLDVVGDQPKGPNDTSIGSEKVVFRLFSGVAPRRFASLFEKRDELKQNGQWIQPEHVTARHTDPTLDQSFLQLEERIATHAAWAEKGGEPT
jgi:hypothetical protein